MEGRTQAKLKVHMLGRCRLVVNGVKVLNEDWRSKKALSLFKYLLAQRGKKVPKEVLLDLLWPDTDPEDANRNLHTTVHFVRRMIQPELVAYQASSYIRHSHGMYWFDNSTSCWIDVEEFERLYHEGNELEREDLSEALARYKEALALYRGDFLAEDAYEEWTVEVREQLRELFITLSLRSAELLVQLESNTTEAVRICRLGLVKDPYREELHQAIMSHLIQVGRYAEAAAQYRQVTKMLNDEFGLYPSPETQALFNRMKSLTGRTHDGPLEGSGGPRADSPFICDLKTFNAIKTMALRVQSRHGESVALLSIVLRTPTPDQMESILDRLQGTLRHSDVLCLDYDRVLILLLHTEQTGCDIVKRRIDRILSRNGHPSFTITASVFQRTDEGLSADAVH